MSHESRLFELIERIASVDPAGEDRAWERLDSLTKPPRSLGRLEEVAARVSMVQGTDRPRVEKKVVLLMAGDHGVVDEGVALFPQEVTWQMVANFTAGGAAINQICRSVGADVRVHDVGVAKDLEGAPGIEHVKVGYGTANMAVGPAMTREQCAEAMLVGVEAARRAASEGYTLLAIGEMGIGNTTSASALTAAFNGADIPTIVGPGTGSTDEIRAKKIDAIERALAVNDVANQDPFGVLAAVGGYEIAAMAGAVIGAAIEGVCIISDGVISGSAALSALRIAPAVRPYLFPSHCSMEPAHEVLLGAMDLEPLLRLDMRLGEGTGAAVAMGIVDAACEMMSGMATFAEAGVSGSDA